MKRALAVAAFSALIGFLVIPPAQAAKRPTEAVQASAPGPAHSTARPAARPLDVDEAFIAAYRAFRSDDRGGFEKMARAAATHPLAVYLDYWRLRMRLLSPTQDAGPGSADAADADARRFIERHEGSLVGDLARRDWLLSLGERGQWNLFDPQHARWILQDDDEVHCHEVRSRVERGRAAPDARAAFLASPKPGKACFQLLDAQLRTRQIDRDGLAGYLRIALERNSVDTIRQLGLRLDLNAAGIEQALMRPEQALSGKTGRELAVIALARLARKDPGRAARWLDASGTVLDEPERGFLRAQIAAAAMRDLDSRALDWTRSALDAAVSDGTRVWLARAALRGHDWSLLKAIIDRMSASGRQDPAWIYWRARAERETGDPVRATALLESLAHRHDFYGQLAAADLGRPIDIPPPAPASSEEELRPIAANPGFDRALRFYALGLRFEGNREWNFQLRGMNDRQLLAAARWACGRQIFDRCVNTADRTRSEHDFALRFVAPFRERMQPTALAAGLDPAWVYGLIRQESRFIMDARSSAGAQGLMQIMPATARWIAGKLGESGFHVGKLHDLDTNLRFGTFYLRTVLDDLDGSPILAAAAYNAGPRRSQRWRSRLAQPVEGAIFAEIIPFAETRNYVKNVFSNTVYYAALFSGEPQSLRERLGSVGPAREVTARADVER